MAVKVKVIKVIKNDFTERLQKMLSNTFNSLPIEVKVNYFLGETEKDEKILCFAILNNKIGMVYEKSVFLKDYETHLDVEDSLMDNVLNDLVLAGVTFVNGEKMDQYVKTQPLIINMN